MITEKDVEELIGLGVDVEESHGTITGFRQRLEEIVAREQKPCAVCKAMSQMTAEALDV